MTSFIHASGGFSYLGEDDWRLDSTWISDLERESIRVRSPFSFRNQYWPGSTGFIGDQATDFGVGVLETEYRRIPDLTRGRNSRYGFVGVSRDEFGSPLGQCVVTLFKTSDDSVVDRTMSDVYGAYVASTPFYPDTHWLKIKKTGSPDKQGVTIDTLIGG